MTHLEEITDIWYAYEHNKCEIGELIRDALNLQWRTQDKEILDSIHSFLCAVGWH
jgi:hypothetical protein